jgi:hypothetical protein
MPNQFDPNEPPRYGVRTTDAAAASTPQTPPAPAPETPLAAPVAGTGSLSAPPPVDPTSGAAQTAGTSAAGARGAHGAGTSDAAGSSRLGLVAMVISIVVLVLSPIASAILGNALSPFAIFDSNGQPDYSAMDAAQSSPAMTAIALGATAHFLLGTALGVFALIAGFIAVRRNRGRSFGIVAVVFALLAPIVSYMVFATNLLATAL